MKVEEMYLSREKAIEGVARALCAARFMHGGAIGDDGWDVCPAPLKAEYLKVAEQALCVVDAPDKYRVVPVEWTTEMDEVYEADNNPYDPLEHIVFPGRLQAAYDAAPPIRWYY